MYRVRIIWLLVFTVTVSSRVSANTCETNYGDDFRNSHVGLILSPMMSEVMIREIEIYWNHGNYQTGDVISLYTEEPAAHVQPIYSLIPNAPSGIRKTGVQAEFVPTSNLTFVKQCLKYHVAWLRNGVVRKKNCLKTEPNWMAERKQILGNLMMSKVFIPGTHDSSAYAIHERAASERFLEKYIMTQDVDILGQLIYGVRYLDIRVGRYPDTRAIWWANHAFFRLLPLQTIIDQVKTFLDHTEEIVIFDVQEFPVGFGKNLTMHDQLVAYLEEQFAGYFLSKRPWTSTLNSIWSSGRRLIIGYDHPHVISRYESVWPSVAQQWGNVRTIEDLYEYLNRIEDASRGSYRTVPRAAMAELTPNTLDVVLNRLGSLRKMAHTVNANVTYWYNTKWQRTANVVAVDFVRSSGIIETAIEWNERRNAMC